MCRYSVLFLLAAAAFAQKPFEFWPGASYDSRVPAMRQVLGYEPGEKITGHSGILRYLEALEAATPRLKVFEYGRSWEGRKLIYAAIGSEANMRRLGEIRASMQRLADPRRTPEAEARRIVSGLPAVVWLAYGVHGNETSSPDAALLTAYHLLAARNDPVVESILSKVLVLIDPVQNPDGRERSIHHFEEALGLQPDPSSLAAEHHEPWPGGRGNHYLFDLNRDWFSLTQPEIRSQVRALREWYPLVYVDLHEMGPDASYFFSPEAEPFNPNLAEDQRANLRIFGRNNAKWFDKFGFDYFTRDIYDAFYPGYGASWPSYYGAVAMTYEQASARGLVLRRGDDTLLHFRDAVRRHFAASISTCETAAANRDKLLADFYRYRATAIEEGLKQPLREYILPRGGNASATDKLVSLLLDQGVEVQRATAPFHSGDREYPAGTYVVPLAQPAKRLIRTLLDPVTPMGENFVRQEEMRRQRKARSEIYDVTAWSLPLMFNVEAIARPDRSQGRFEPVRGDTLPAGSLEGDRAAIVYLAPWGTEAAGRLLAAAWRENLSVFSSDRPIGIDGTRFPAGTLIFKVKDNPQDLPQRLERLARQTGAKVHATGSGWVEEGVNFGSRFVIPMRRPNVALAWDEPVSSAAAGATRYVLERQYGFPVTAIRVDQLKTADLRRFQVLLLPDARDMAGALGSEGIGNLKDWVSAGGTLVALGPSAVGFLADTTVELLAVSPENAVRAAAEAKQSGDDSGRVPGKIIVSEAEYRKAIQTENELPDSASGVLVRARVAPDHWLTAGAADSVCALLTGRSIFTPLKLDKGVNAAVFDAPEKVLASGFLWEENRKQIAFKPLLLVQPDERGLVIGFTADPNYRAFLDGMNVLFLNAVFRAPAHAHPTAGE